MNQARKEKIVLGRKGRQISAGAKFSEHATGRSISTGVAQTPCKQ
jgi:hypothetical protein